MLYDVVEIFRSIQGEGRHMGRDVVFLRLSYCNLSCSWCDTQFNVKNPMTINDITAEVNRLSFGIRMRSIIITGGEPTQYDLLPLLIKLKLEGYWTAIESNGMFDIGTYRHLLDHVTVSPKGLHGIKVIDPDECKVVVDRIQSTEFCCRIKEIIKAKYYYLSPVYIDGEFKWKVMIQVMSELNQLKNHDWRLSVQVHKFLGMR